MVKSLFTNKVLGLVFIALIAAALWGINGVFTKKFVSYDDVRLLSSSAGLNLPEEADVKVRGVIVGEVREQQSHGKRAILTLGIESDKINQIPRNVTASLIPKTLFGEKYVSLDIPRSPASAHLQDGDTIRRTELPVEVEKVLDDLYPLLRAVRPADVSYTLNALATALEGRGEKIGRAFGTLDGYLKRTNPQVPTLISDLRLLSSVSNTYADVMPQLAATLRNTVKTGHTLVSKEATLRQLLGDVSSFSDTTRSFLDANGNNIIALGKVSRPTLDLLARYSPEYPCLLHGLVRQTPRLASTFRGFIFHINLETLKRQPRGYGPQDHQVYGAANPPTCAGLPAPSASQANPYGSPSSPYKTPNFNDGVNGLGRGDNQRPATGFASSAASGAASTPDPARPLVTMGGTSEARALVNSLTAPALGVPVDRVPGVTSLLFGPVAAGTEVSN